MNTTEEDDETGKELLLSRFYRERIQVRLASTVPAVPLGIFAISPSLPCLSLVQFVPHAFHQVASYFPFCLRVRCVIVLQQSIILVPILKQAVISLFLTYSLWLSHSWLSFSFGANEVRLRGALKPPLLISFHHSARGRLETARPVIAFFRQPSADWPAANQSLVYTLWLTTLWQHANQSNPFIGWSLEF